MPPAPKPPTPSTAHLIRDQLRAGARAAVRAIAPALRHLSADELATRAERLVEGIRHHAGAFLADARIVAGEAGTTAEQHVAERLTARIKAKVAPPIQAAILIALVALLVALLALYRTRGGR